MSNTAETTEGTGSDERADAPESIVFKERAGQAESTARAERAAQEESIVFKERAEITESTVGVERRWNGFPTQMSRGVIPLILTLALCQPVAAQQFALPDPTLTPGSILDIDPIVICAPGYPEAHRVWHSKRRTAAKYGIPWSVAKGMEDDDLCPIGLGGDNTDSRNHWLQPRDEAIAKDVQEHRDEAFVCRVLRDQGSIAATKVLHERQQYYLTNGWAK